MNTNSFSRAPPTNDHLGRLLENILGDPHLLSLVASRSYRHQLGFMKYVLATPFSSEAIRLHHWDAQPAASEDIHSHCASFASRLVSGEMAQETFAIHQGQTHSIFSYRFDDRTSMSIATLAGRCSVSLEGSQRYEKGCTYELEAKTLHRVTEAEIGTVTISSWDARTHDALVLKLVGQTAPECAGSGVDTRTVRKNLTQVLRMLK